MFQPFECSDCASIMQSRCGAQLMCSGKGEMSKSIMAYLALVSLVLAALVFGFTFLRQAQTPGSDPRLALVIGNADYTGDPLATAVNDAGLVADALRAAGFEVSGAANLDQDSMRRVFWDFLSRAAQAGPRAIIFVYLSGRGLQYQGENYFAPIGAAINRVGDAPTEALRVSDVTQALASMPLRARIFVLDAARENRFAQDEQPCGNRFAQDGQPFAGGLALVEAAPGAHYAFNAAPGTIAPNEPAPYGAYAKALAEMLRVRGIPIDEAFSRARLRVNELTRGAFVPWDAAKLVVPVVLLPATPDAPAPVSAPSYAAIRARPIREFPAMEAYSAAIERDTLEGYAGFLIAYPDDRLAGRVRALLAARREALTWRRAIEANTPNAYWSYQRRYPHGPHFADARGRLIRISAAPEPPPRFDFYDFVDVPPPPPLEYVIVDRPVIVFSIIFSNDYPPPPPPPVYFLPLQPVAFVDLAPPPLPKRGSLPIPVPIPISGGPIAPQTRCADGSSSESRGSGVCSHHRGAASEAQGQAAPTVMPCQRPRRFRRLLGIGYYRLRRRGGRDAETAAQAIQKARVHAAITEESATSTG
jgi:uncharacterized caspase-like protein